MKKVTRTLNVYEITAYDIVKSDATSPAVTPIARAQTQSAGMNRHLARKALAEATGEKVKKGLTIDWQIVGKATYAMPLDEFLEHAILISHEDNQ